MYDFMYKNKGAISIFLVIVLVPMLVFSSIFVDMSRINLAKSVAESSGELTLNTALTNYDAVLKDMYGLFATSQDTDELFENLENYYRQCIEAAGVAEADADNYVDQIMQFIKSETGTDDMLNMNLTSFEVTKPTGGSLANPAVLKSQIVEFMKYRGPINLGTGIFDALSSLKNVKKQSALVDNKNKFYDQHTNMMEKLESVWNALEDYQYRDAYTMYGGDKCTFPDGDYLKLSAERMNDCVEPLKLSVAYVVRYLYFADSNYVKHYGYSITREDSTDDAYTDIWVINPDDTKYKVNAIPDEKTGSVDTVIADLKVVYRLAQKLERNDSLVLELSAGNSNLSDTEKIRLVSKTTSLINSGYQKDVKDFIAALVELQNAWNNCDSAKMAEYTVFFEEGTNGNYNTLRITNDENATGDSRGPLGSFAKTQLDAHLKESAGHIKNYNGLMSRVYQYWEETNKIVSAAKTYVKDCTSSAENYAWIFDSFLEGKIKKLDAALSTLTTIKSELSNSESDYNKALAAWKSSANGLSGETIGDNDLSEIAKLEKVLTVAKVEALYNRVEKAKNTLVSIQNQVGQFKVLGKAWKELESNGAITYSTLQKLLTADQKSSISNVSKSTSSRTETIKTSNGTTISAKYDTAYDTVINTLKATVTSTQIKTSWTPSEDSVSPNLVKSQVELYTWLYNNFFDKAAVEAKFDIGAKFEDYTPTPDTDTNTSTDISTSKDDADDTQDEMEKKADEYNNKSTDAGTTPDRVYDASFLPSGEWSGVLDAVKANGDVTSDSDAMLSNSTNTLSTLDGVMNLVGNMATTLRDDLYIVNYIMNMFSYSTFESEISVKNGNDVNAFESWYEWNASENKYQLKSTFSNYTNSSQMLKDARTLTKVSINPNANYLYGKEVEYIIYGGGDINGDGVIDDKDNPLVASYGTIYMLRFALNTVYAFTDAEINNVTTAAATAIFGTPPLTPLIPVAKIAMTIGLSLAESAYDLYELKSGKEIPLIKSNDTWVMKPSNAAKEVVGQIAVEVGDVVIDEGLKALNGALEMTNDELQKKIDEGELALGELAESALSATVSELNNYGNQAIQQIVSICNDIRNEEMQKVTKDDNGNVVQCVTGQSPEKIETAVQRLNQWLTAQSGTDTDVVYLAKKTAVDYLTNNDGAVIGELFDLLENKESLDATALGEKLENKLRTLQGTVESKITELIRQGGNALSELADEAEDKLKEAAKNGAESLKSALREQVGNVFGTSTSAQSSTNNVVSSLLAWSYSDYLQLFLLIGIVASPESILLRTADVIELNMQQIDGNLGYVEVTTETEVSRLWGLIKYTKTETKKEANADAFKLSKSYTYLNIKATIEVKPMMLTLPLLGDTVKSQLTGTNWYQIVYEGTMGY